METAVSTCAVLGVPLAVTTYAGAAEIVREWARTGQKVRAVAAANTHLVSLARTDAAFGETMRKFDLTLPDGMPLVWVMNSRLKQPLEDRVYGPTYMLRTLESTQGPEWRHMLLGGTEELLEALRGKLAAQFPALSIVKTYAPPFGQWPAEETERILGAIAEARPHFVWVGLGCPKQETWIAANKDRLPPAVYSAVGAAFAFHAGRVRQAPAWMQKRGLEWLFRLASEPQRLWRRYFVYNTLFVWHLLRERFTGRL